MIIENNNPSKLVLQITTLSFNGAVKTDISSATVRVYHLNSSGIEIEDLAETSLSQVGSSNTWRYFWSDSNTALLESEHYIAEYTLEDSNGIITIETEDIIIGYLVDNLTALQDDVTVIKEIETGKWKIVGTQLILFKSDNLTEICRFNLFDSLGNPSPDNVFERVRT